MADQPITLDDVKRLDVQPGDTLVLRYDKWLSRDEQEQFSEAFRAEFGDDVRVMILEGGLRLDGIISGLPEPERKTA